MTGLQTLQQTQTAEWFNDVAKLLQRVGGEFADLKRTTQERLLAHTHDIGKLSDDFASVRAKYAERFKAIAAGVQRGDALVGWRSAQDAQQFGELVAALKTRDMNRLNALQQNGLTPGTGAQGGWLLNEQLIADIMREVDAAGIFLADCPPRGVNMLAGGSPLGTSGAVVYYPDYGAAGTVSTPGTGNTRFELKRHVAAIEIDQWMLGSDLAITLAEYVRTEIIYALSLATDTNWFMGTGVAANCMKTGLFKLTGSATVSTTAPTVVTADSGDDTFAKCIAKTTYYLAQMLGMLPQWAHAAGPRWYCSSYVFFNYLGVRDSGGMPLAQIYLGQDAPSLRLCGLPVRIVSVAPSVTAVSTVFLLLGALSRACRTYRHNRAVEFAWNDNLEEAKWLAGLSAVKCDVPLDRVVRVPSGIVQLITHS